MSYPQAFMADNYRPITPLNRRPVRTNINFVSDMCVRILITRNC